MRERTESLKALGTEGTQMTRKPDVISPMDQSPMGPTLKVMSSAPRARVVDTRRMAPQTQPLGFVSLCVGYEVVVGEGLQGACGEE